MRRKEMITRKVGDRGRRERNNRGRNRKIYIKKTVHLWLSIAVFLCTVNTWDASWIHMSLPITVRYDEDVVPNCLACKTEQHGFPEITTAESNRAHQHTAYLGLFLESVNNRCLTRKRIPSVTLSNGGLALFLKHKKENTTKTQKLPQMKQTSQRPFSQNKKFLSHSKTFSVWRWVWG